MKLLLLAVLTTRNAGAVTGVIIVLEQFAPPGQLGSPPPTTVPVLLRLVPLAAACGVIGMMKLTGLLMARGAAIVQVTVCPLAVHPLGSVPIVSVLGIVSVTVLVAVVAAEPLLVTIKVYVAGTPTISGLLLTVLRITNCGAFTGVPVVLVQFGLLTFGQVGSPPPLTVAVLFTVVPFAAGNGVTGITKLTLAPTARPAATVQVTCWPVMLQPDGALPRLKLAGTLSLIVVIAVVAALPMLVTVSV